MRKKCVKRKRECLGILQIIFNFLDMESSKLINYSIKHVLKLPPNYGNQTWYKAISSTQKSRRTVQHVLDEKEQILCQFAAVKMALGKQMFPGCFD
jgi:hypothetical protein